MAHRGRWLFASHGQNLANLLRRERAGTTRTRLVRQEIADRLSQGFGLGLQFFQIHAALKPAPPPKAHRVFAQAHLGGDRFVRTTLADRQHHLGALHHAMRGFAAAREGLEKFGLLGGQIYGRGRTGHLKKYSLS